ncbi:putative phosphoglycerate mutase DET1 [Kluyveromyces marxianus DMKU3-1042]|uniref:Putative phosphoglycerate mutase DET1 n=1 Tax=Kluyveromyces marxianus (strain DMKU3-1042 / BCC 29191 / NBRC 104275) TaxID=1003335 RepID=W0TAT4_KLUMD|nr:putative phosphoglycerate mutase DET1 [Kluyveromyces marxianus DMKU3-1042]BAO40148.1 putative phosphoglycerate mutase DET1 [Kluyveromyces marxianus DMKU3-1042]
MKPRLILLIRHGESESNKDKKVNEHTPNHLIPLTKNGMNQARMAGIEILKLLNVDDDSLIQKIEQEQDHPDDRKKLEQNYKRVRTSKDTDIVFYTSPYRRTRETLKGIIEMIDRYNELNTGIKVCEGESYQPLGTRRLAHWQCPAFPSAVFENSASVTNLRKVHTTGVPTTTDSSTSDQNQNQKNFLHYRVKEEPRIREQDFGNFQQTESMTEVMNTRANYGHFFFRLPQGESAADVYDRCSGFQESLFRHFERSGGKKRDVVAIVTHGIFLRVFLMKWFRWTYEEFESLMNVPNGSVIIMELDETLDRYVLRTKLPKWTTTGCDDAAAGASTSGSNSSCAQKHCQCEPTAIV